MEEALKQIVVKIDALGNRMENIDEKFDALGDRMDAHDRSNNEEFRLLNKKIDVITGAVAKNMEDIYVLKTQVKKHDIELQVLKQNDNHKSS